MSFSSDHSLNNYKLQENPLGIPSVNNPQEMYGPYDYVPAMWGWPQQQVNYQQTNPTHQQINLQGYENYYYQTPWQINQQHQQHSELQTRYNLEHFGNQTRTSSANVRGTQNGVDSFLPENTFGGWTFSASNGHPISCRSEPHDPTCGTIGQADTHLDHASRGHNYDVQGVGLSCIYGVQNKTINDTRSNKKNASHQDASHSTYPIDIPHLSGRTKKIPRIKGLYEPRKSTSPYGLFFSEKHAQIKELNPYATFGEVSKMVGKLWRNENDDGKDYYRNRVMEAKESYVKYFATYLLKPKYFSKIREKPENDCPCNMANNKAYHGPKRYSGSGEEEDNAPMTKKSVQANSKDSKTSRRAHPTKDARTVRVPVLDCK